MMEESSKRERPNSVFYISPEVLVTFDDLTHLPYLYDETVVDCVEARYHENKIYTWAGPILVAVNPLKSINLLYSINKIQRVYDVLKEGKDHKEPHVFTVAGIAHRRLVAEVGLINQAVLVSGESGAGKTESAKYILTYLTNVESKETSSVKGGIDAKHIQKRVLASNPIMEAFGNASTLRNHNSSRFGKMIFMQYTGSTLRGAALETYLLERTRVTSQPTSECNFHIFYQVTSGLRKRGQFLGIELEEDSSSFRITPEAKTRDSVIDAQNFEETLEAFRQIGFSEFDLREIVKVIVALLHLGNITFSKAHDDKDNWTVSDSRGSGSAVERACHCLGLQVGTLQEALTVRKISVSSANKTSVFNKACEREDECKARLDALMQLLYASAFSFLVSSINKKTRAEKSLVTSYLGVLDIYGFEAFEDNSLEQLCINYTNERLQQEFTRRYIASEHRMLIEEGFMEFPFTYSDNERCVRALDSSISVFTILNEECQLRRALNEEAACERVCNALQDTGIVLPFSSKKKSGFLIKHYARNVNYSSSGLLQKNRDEVPQDVVDLLSKSSNEFISNLVSSKTNVDGVASKPRRSVKKVTTLSKFKGSLDSLLQILKNCDLHYVRCLKPKDTGVAGVSDKVFLLDQLRTNGILETVKISRAGYPVRMFYSNFAKRYDVWQRLDGFDDKETSFILLSQVLGQDDSTNSPPQRKCRFGKHRIFLSESCLHDMEQMRDHEKSIAATRIQKNLRRYIERKRFRTKMWAIVTLQKEYLRWVRRRRYLRMKDAALVIQKTFRGFRERKDYEKKLRAVRIIQKHWKGWLCRKRFLLHLRTNQLLEDSRCHSRISFSSTGYGSFAPSSFTDYSASEAETATSVEGRGGGPRSLFETEEESGIETDTESLSGEWHKAGRASRLRSRHNFAQFSRPEGRGSDDESSDVVLSTTPTPKLRANPPVHKGSRSTAKHSGRLPAGRGPEKPSRKAHNCDLVSKSDFAAFKNMLRTEKKSSTSLRGFSLCFWTSFDVCIFYKDGVLSYRHSPTSKIIFHTRRTCIPYSTHLPFHGKPRGLAEALR